MRNADQGIFFKKNLDSEKLLIIILSIKLLIIIDNNHLTTNSALP